MERDNEDQKLIKLEWIRGIETIMEEEDLRERIKKAQEGDEKIVKVVEELKRAGIKALKNEEWEVEDEIVLKEERIYVPKGDLRREIIQLHHNTPIGGHRRR